MRRTQAELRDMRAAWAERPQPAPPWWTPDKPAWLRRSREHRGTWVGEERLYEVGEVHWGWVLMANNRMWLPGPEAAPGEVLWSPDPYVAGHPSWLQQPMEAYWRLRDPPDIGQRRLRTDVPGLEALVGFASEDRRVAKRRRFPTLLSRQRVVYHEVVLFYREHLPGRMLADSRVPLVLHPTQADLPARVLPQRFWPPDLRVGWEREGKKQVEAEKARNKL